MKKLFITLLLTVLAFGLYADNAKVLPKGVFRLTLTDTYASFDEAYDDDGEAQDYIEFKMDLVGGAFELGLTNQINLGIQWAPAAVVWSDVDVENALYTGLDKLFIGFKTQVVGESGYVSNNKIRLCLAPGVVLPLQKYDGEAEFTSAITGDEFQLKSVDNEAIGLGGRLYLDYQVNEELFVNLYSEAIYNLPVTRTLDAMYSTAVYEEGINDAMTAGYDFATAEALARAAATDEYEQKYGLDFLVELDPHYEMAMSEKDTLKFNLPIRYKYKPENEIGALFTTDSGYLLTAAPEVGFFCGSTLLPWEVSVNYNLPVAGKNTNKVSSVTLKVRLFGKIF